MDFRIVDHFRIVDQSFDIFLDIYPRWIIEAANKITRSKGIDFASLTVGPQHRIPVHDALHCLLGIEVTQKGEQLIAALEFYLAGETLELVDPEAREGMALFEERLEEYQKIFFRIFYASEPILFGVDFADYGEEYEDFLYEEAPEIYQRLYGRL